PLSPLNTPPCVAQHMPTRHASRRQSNMPSTRRQHHATRSQGQQQQMVLIDIDKPQGRFSAFSARHRPILEPRPNQQENQYLCAWLRSRLEDGLWLIRQESALTATEQQRRQ